MSSFVECLLTGMARAIMVLLIAWGIAMAEQEKNAWYLLFSLVTLVILLMPDKKECKCKCGD